jgi:DNA-binding transcriptional MocR family regulator
MATIRSRNVHKETSFDFADKQLELAQSLCEAAAHQFLRSGDCSTELENIQQKFKLVLETAESEVERLLEEKKLEEKKPEEKKSEEKKLEEGKMAETPKPVVPAADKPVDPDLPAIEVDDDSGSSISIDISAFRSTRFG